MDEKKVEKALAKFLKNPYWRAVYEDAPSPRTKRHQTLSFYFSEHNVEMHACPEMFDELKAEEDRLESEMDLEDFKYLFIHCGNNPNRTKYGNRIRELGGGDWIESGQWKKDGDRFERRFQEGGSPREKKPEKSEAPRKAEFATGYLLTFHQNLTPHDAYGGYTDETYAIMCAIAKRELGSEPYIGLFGHGVAMFHCENRQKASEFSAEHNQYGVWNCKRERCEVNAFYDADTNPLIEE